VSAARVEKYDDYFSIHDDVSHTSQAPRYERQLVALLIT